MASTSVVLRSQAAGIESVSGTAVSPTRRFYGRGSLIPQQEIVVPHYEYNSFFPTYEVYRGMQMSRFTFTGALCFEDLPFWGRLVLGPAPTPVLVSSLYQWDYTPDPITPSATTTWEWFSGSARFTAPYCLCERFTLSASAGSNGLATVAASFLGKPAIQTAASGPSFTTDSARTSAMGSMAKVYLDSDPGTFGGNQVIGAVTGFEYSIAQPARTRGYEENGTTFSDMTHGPREVSARVRMRFTDTAEFGHWQRHDTRLLRISFGTPINASLGAVSLLGYGRDHFGTDQYGSPSWISGGGVVGSLQSAYFDLVGVWSEMTIGEQGGTVVADYKLLPRFDLARGFDTRMFVSTSVSTLAAA